jgi:acetate kinase
MAPLHNLANIRGIEWSMKYFSSKVYQMAMFDSSFHVNTMPPKAYMYPLPMRYYEEKRIRRFGFHGISYHHTAKEAAKYLQRNLYELDIISLHLGSGCSACAIKNGMSIDTSMGFTPLEGNIFYQIMFYYNRI